MSITSFELLVTHSCNMRCDYCFDNNFGVRTSQTKMEIDEIPKLLKYIKSVKAETEPLDFTFFGGEPLVNFPFITAFVESAKKELSNILTFGLTTNASLITPEIIDFFIKHDFGVVVSLDGSKENHESSREKNWEHTIERISLLLAKTKKPITVNWTIGSYSFSNFFQSYKYLADIARMGAIQINPLIDYDADWTDENIERLSHLFIEAIAKTKITPTLFGKMHHQKTNVEKYGYEQQRGYCFTPGSHVTISADMNLFFCHRFIPKNDTLKNSYGNIEEGMITGLFEEMKKRVDLHFDQCVGCSARHWCRGGCIAAHYHQTKDLSKLDERHCEVNRGLTDAMGGR